jgi:hypothetical protein
MSKVTITNCTYVPRSPEDFYEEDLEQPDDFPQFKCEGTVNGENFECLLSLELEGRDVDYDHLSGVDVEGDPDLMQDLIQATWLTPAFQVASDAYQDAA